MRCWHPQIDRLDPATKQFAIYDVPIGVKYNKNASPYGMAVGRQHLVRGECIRPDRAR